MSDDSDSQTLEQTRPAGQRAVLDNQTACQAFYAEVTRSVERNNAGYRIEYNRMRD